MGYKKIILVTGGAGFIGSNYLNLFVPRYPDYFFVNVDALTYVGKLENITVASHPNYAFERADIRNFKRLEEIFERHHPADIIHFAAETHVDFSIKNPNIFVETNVDGTANLLLLAKQFGIKRFVFVSTDEVYGELRDLTSKFTEESAINPSNPYSASKAGAEMLVRSFQRTFGLDVVITRGSNTFGPRQDASKLIPKFIILLLKGERVPLYSKGENIRDWIFVEDHTEAIDLVWRRGKSGEVYNIGGGNEKTNLEITRLLIKLLERDESYIQFVQDRPGHDFRYALSSEKIKKELGWQSKFSFEEALNNTIAFYSALSRILSSRAADS